MVAFRDGRAGAQKQNQDIDGLESAVFIRDWQRGKQTGRQRETGREAESKEAAKRETEREAGKKKSRDSITKNL